MWILLSTTLLFHNGEVHGPSNSVWFYDNKYECEAQLTTISRNNPSAKWKDDVLTIETKNAWETTTEIRLWSCN